MLKANILFLQSKYHFGACLRLHCLCVYVCVGKHFKIKLNFYTSNNFFFIFWIIFLCYLKIFNDKIYTKYVAYFHSRSCVLNIFYVKINLNHKDVITARVSSVFSLSHSLLLN